MMNSDHYFLHLRQLGSRLLQLSVIVDGDLMEKHSPAHCNFPFLGTPFVNEKVRDNDSKVHRRPIYVFSQEGRTLMYFL